MLIYFFAKLARVGEAERLSDTTDRTFLAGGHAQPTARTGQDAGGSHQGSRWGSKTDPASSSLGGTPLRNSLHSVPEAPLGSERQLPPHPPPVNCLRINAPWMSSAPSPPAGASWDPSQEPALPWNPGLGRAWWVPLCPSRKRCSDPNPWLPGNGTLCGNRAVVDGIHQDEDARE